MIAVHILFLLAAMAFVLVLLPRFIFPLDRVEGTAFDRVLAGAVYMTALTLAAMYVLATIGLLELLGVVVVWGAAWWVIKGRHGPRRRRFTGLIERMFRTSDRLERRQFSERGPELSPGPGAALRSTRRRSMRDMWTERPGTADILIPIAVLVVLGIAAALRFSRALSHVDLVPQDSYASLVYTTFINKGKILADGTYPQGTYMWASMINRFYPFGVYDLMRFIGPIMSTLELVMLYWAVSRATRNRAAGLLSIAVIGFFAGDPALLVDWSRQIGSMSQEFALGFALVSIVAGARYMVSHRGSDLALFGCALFISATSHALPMPLLAVAFAIIILVGLATRSWERHSLLMLVGLGISMVVAANLYFVLGWLRGIPLNQAFEIYNPSNRVGFGAVEVTSTGHAWDLLRNNSLYLLGTIGAVIGAVAGILSVRRRRDDARVLLAVSLVALVALLVYDAVGFRWALLFRTRQGWITAQMLLVGLGVGLGGLGLLAAGVAEQVRSRSQRERPTGLGWRWFPVVGEVVAFVLAVILVVALWPQYSVPASAREVAPSGYPQATDVSLRILANSRALTFTFVGVAEQYQEAIDKGFFTEAWVFARDITFSQARSPAYELTIPTDDVYIFAEKVPFAGPQSAPTGPTQEYYRDSVKRSRLMRRIIAWCEAYRGAHSDMTITYEDRDLRVYRLKRNVDLTQSRLSPAFKDYTWIPGQLFTSSADVTADVIGTQVSR